MTNAESFNSEYNSGLSIPTRNAGISNKEDILMDSINVYWEADGTVVVELEGSAIAMTREEAEVLFVDLGHTLQDMDKEIESDNDDG